MPKKYSNIEDIVRDHVNFSGKVSSKGWNSVYCEVCGDGRRTKGPRGGWLFSDDMVFYNCFNCPAEGNFDPHREYPFSKEMYGIFSSFNIPVKYCYDLIPEDKKGTREVKPKKVEYTFMDPPDFLYPLVEGDPSNSVVQAALNHLEEERLIDPFEFPFYLSNGKTSSNKMDVQTMARTTKNRLIIPAFVNERMIGFEAMALGNQKTKYITHGTHVVHGHDNLFKGDRSNYLFITEGFFDSYHLKGFATGTNNITKSQIELLEKSPRPKIVVPDRLNSHEALAEKALELGWGLSLPKIKPYKDISEAIKNYGILYVVESVMKNIHYGKNAQICLKMYGIL